MTSLVTRSLEIRDHFVTIQQIEYAPDVMSGAYSMPESGVSRVGFEPTTLGLKVWVSRSIVVHQRPVSIRNYSHLSTKVHQHPLMVIVLAVSVAVK